MRNQRYVLLIGIIGLLLFGMVNPAVAGVDWSDDFDDGNYDGWTVNDGTFAVIDGKLQATEAGAGVPAQIEHPSNVTMGTWAFDLEIVDNPEGPELVNIHFLKDESGSFMGLAYGIVIFGGIITLGRISGSELTEFATWPFPDPPPFGLHHIEILHNATNDFYVYVNGTMVIDAMGLFYEQYTYDYFSFQSTIYSSIDNVNVTEWVEPTTTTTTPDTTTTTTEDTTTPPGEPMDMTMILIVGGGIAVVVVIVVIVKMRS